MTPRLKKITIYFHLRRSSLRSVHPHKDTGAVVLGDPKVTTLAKCRVGGSDSIKRFHEKFALRFIESLILGSLPFFGSQTSRLLRRRRPSFAKGFATSVDKGRNPF